MIFATSSGSARSASVWARETPTEAKRLHALKLAEVEERWSNLRNGQRPLSSDDVAQHAAAIGEYLRRQVQADPYKQLQWDVEIGASLWSARKGELYVDATQPLPLADQKRLEQQSVCYLCFGME